MSELYEDIAPQTSEDNTYLMPRHSMFMPKSVKEIFFDYPELRKDDAFKVLTPQEVVFCWYLGHRSSPIIHWTDDSRAAAFAVDNAMITDKVIVKRLKSLEFKEPIKRAISAMTKYRPAARIMAMKMADDMLQNWKKIIGVNIDLSDASEDKMKTAAAYATATKGMFEKIPALISQVESSFSVSINDDAVNESDYMNYLDDWHGMSAKENPK